MAGRGGSAFRTAPCKFYAQGYCRNGNSCRFLHEDNGKSNRNGGNNGNSNGSNARNAFGGFASSRKATKDPTALVQATIDDLGNPSIWPFSVIAVNTNLPNVVDGKDLSMEEVRWEAYEELRRSGSCAQQNQRFQTQRAAAQQERQELAGLLQNPQVRASLLEGKTLAEISGGASPFGQSSSSPFGMGSGNSSSPFGAPSSPFGASSSPFGSGGGGASSAPGNPFGLSAAQPSGAASPFGASQSGNPFGGNTGAMGQTAAMSGQSTTSSPFGSQPPTQQGPFGGTTANQASPFGAQPKPASTVFGNSRFAGAQGTVPSGNPFGSTASSSPFGSQTALTATSQGSGNQSSNGSPFQSQGMNASSTASPFGTSGGFGAQTQSTPSNPFAPSTTSGTSGTSAAGFGASPFGGGFAGGMSGDKPASTSMNGGITAPKAFQSSAPTTTASISSKGTSASAKDEAYIASANAVRDEAWNRDQFQASNFTLGMVPTVPPPPEFCT